MKNKLLMGMVGGGPGAFIGDVHRKASRIDGKIELIGGAFDVNPEKSIEQGKILGLDDSRVYKDYKELIDHETSLPELERMDFVSVVTPNNWHFPIAKDLLEAGFNVMCEKPMTMTVDEAKELKKIVEKSGKTFGLMHNYTGYPMVKLARDMVKNGDVGEIRKIVVRYPQGWLAKPIEREGQMQASWRTDPKQSGAAGSIGDIGTHAENLSEYITGLKITEICAHLSTFVEGRLLDDDGNALLQFDNGASGILHVSQIAIGEENNLGIWIYGTKKSLEWHQEHPNSLYVKEINKPMQVWTRGNDYIGEVSAAAVRATRLPSGHPEAFLEAFANNYLNFGETIMAKSAGQKVDKIISDFPGVDDGIRGMIFIDTVIKSAKSEQKWTSMP